MQGFTTPLEGIELRGRDSSARKIPRSKLLRTDKQTTAKPLSFFVGLLIYRRLVHIHAARSMFGLG